MVLKKNENASPVFELKAVQCKEKRSVLCRTESKKNESPKPSRFPCISSSSKNRNKRAATRFPIENRDLEGKNV